mmetsp:Transcript_8030/g.49605  ORF Transcript_8030/g.49605 Transcript_8030/m.49605 type:complete len:229 (-) Transcript_8030:59-745(-)
MEFQALAGQVLGTPLFSINQHNYIIDLQAFSLEWFHRFHDRHTACHQVFDNETRLSGMESTFDGFFRPVIFHFLPPHQHGDIGVHRHDSGDGQCSVWNPTHDLVFRPFHGTVHGACHIGEQIGIRNDHPEVEIDGRHDATLEFEFSKLDRLHFVQSQHEFFELFLGELFGIFSTHVPCKFPYPRVLSFFLHERGTTCDVSRSVARHRRPSKLRNAHPRRAPTASRTQL